jgi:hypothetical protein
LATSLPFRPAEVGLIHFQHTFPDLDMLEVTTSGYSHLKRPESSRRRIPVPHSISDVLTSLKNAFLLQSRRQEAIFSRLIPSQIRLILQVS